MQHGAIVIYKAYEALDFQIEVRVEDETVWLTQAQMAELFDATKQNVRLRINNIFREGELKARSVVKESLTVRFFTIFVYFLYNMRKKVREIIHMLESDGWVFHRQKGSHKQYRHPSKKGLVTVPDHGKNDELNHYLVHSILKQAGLK